MLITNKQLNNLKVITESGKNVGTVVNFNIQTESQSIVGYIVKPAKLIEGLLKGNLIINRGQVINITKDELIVEDNVAKKEKVGKLQAVAAKQEEGAMISQTSSKQ